MNIVWSDSEKNVLVTGARKILKQQPYLSNMRALRQAMFTLLPIERQRPALNKGHVTRLLDLIGNKDLDVADVVEVAEDASQQSDTNTVDLLAEVLESVIVQTIKRLLTNPEISTILQQLLNKSK